MPDPTTQNSPAVPTVAPGSPPPAPPAASPPSAPTTQPPADRPAGDPALVGTRQRPEGLPDSFWDDAQGVKIPELLAEHKTLAEFKAQADAAAASRPKAADDYKPALPEGFTLPDGWEIKAETPLFKEAQKVAFERGLTQEQFSAVLALDAKQKLEQTKAIQEGLKARDAALGPNGGARVEALHRWLDGAFDAETARDMKAGLVTPKQIAALETIQKTLATQGIAGFTQGGRQGAPEPGKIEGYGKMTFEQKMAAARASVATSQQPSTGRR